MGSDLYSTSFTTIGYIAFWFAFAIILFFWTASAVSFISQREIVRRQQRYLFGSFVVALAVWALLWDPAPYYDSFRHFIWLDQIRSQELSLWEFLTEGFSGSRTGNYKGLIAFNILRHVVTKLSNDNHMLPFVSTTICYLIFYYIVTDFFKDKKIKYSLLFPSCVLCFSFMPYFMVVSGIRNALAASIAAFVLYQRIHKNKGIIYYIVGALIVITVHPSLMIPIAVGLVYPIFKGARSFYLLFIGMAFLSLGVNILMNSNISFLAYIGNAISYYLNEGKYFGEMITYVVDIVVLTSIIVFFYINRRELRRHSEKGFQFYRVYMVIVLAMAFLGGTNFLTRSGYVLGPLAVFLIDPIYQVMSSKFARHKFYNIVLGFIILIACLINIADGFILLLAQFF